MSWSLALNGRTYSDTIFLSDGRKGYYTVKYTIDGVEYPALIAAMVDTLSAGNQGLNTTSASSNSVGTGSKTFVLAADRYYQPGMNVWVVDSAAPTTNKMYGEVTSYTSGTKTLIVNVTEIVGSGTKTAWSVFSAGPKGASGAGSVSAEFAAAASMTTITHTDELIINSGGTIKKITFGELTNALRASL